MTDHPDSTLASEATSEAEATAPAGQMGAGEPAASTEPPGWRTRLPLQGIPLSRVQVVVGLTAGLLSISGFLYPALRASRMPLPLGEVVTVVHEAGSRRSVTDATVEILTPGHVLVTTLTPRDEGRARHVIKEGTYRVRVTHPEFALETRSIQVLAGTIAEIRFQLSPRRSQSVVAPAAAPAAIRAAAPAAPSQPAAARAPEAPPRPAAPRAPEPSSRPAAPRAAAPAARSTPAAVSAPTAVTTPRPAAAVEAVPTERPRDATGLRRSLLRDHQSP